MSSFGSFIKSKLSRFSRTTAHVPIDDHAQLQSPLFSTLPAELRNQIFYLALQEHEAPEQRYSRETYYTRPGFTGQKSIDLALLRTCKRIHAEVRDVVDGALLNMEIVFYLGDESRCPPEYERLIKHDRSAAVSEFYGWTHKFTPAIWAKVKKIHVFSQLYAFPDFRHVFMGHKTLLNPETITITLRYTDWWHWEYDAELTLEDMNMTLVTMLPRNVREVVVEFETRDDSAKKEELEVLVREVVKKAGSMWAWKRQDGRILVVDKTAGACGVMEWKWTGPTTYGDGKPFGHHEAIDGGGMGFVVMVVRWVIEGVDEAGA